MLMYEMIHNLQLLIIENECTHHYFQAVVVATFSVCVQDYGLPL